MPGPDPKKPKAPDKDAPVAEHRRHVEEFLTREEHKDPKKVNLPGYRDYTDEAKP